MLEYRTATVSDRDAIADLELRAGALFCSVGLDWVAQLPQNPADIEELITTGTVWLLILEQRLLGWAGVFWRDEDAHLQELDIDPAHGRQGHGTRLLHYVEERARARGYRNLALTTFRDVPWNGPWYAREGFMALPDHELPLWLAKVRAEERRLGLDRAPRLAMLKPLV